MTNVEQDQGIEERAQKLTARIAEVNDQYSSSASSWQQARVSVQMIRAALKAEQEIGRKRTEAEAASTKVKQAAR